MDNISVPFTISFVPEHHNKLVSRQSANKNVLFNQFNLVFVVFQPPNSFTSVENWEISFQDKHQEHIGGFVYLASREQLASVLKTL